MPVAVFDGGVDVGENVFQRPSNVVKGYSLLEERACFPEFGGAGVGDVILTGTVRLSSPVVDGAPYVAVCAWCVADGRLVVGVRRESSRVGRSCSAGRRGATSGSSWWPGLSGMS